MITLGHIVQVLGTAAVGGLGVMVLAHEVGRALESRRSERDCPFCRGAGCEHCRAGIVDDRELRGEVIG